MSSQHLTSVEANKKQFDKNFASEYDKAETTQAYSLLFSQRLLTMNTADKRISVEESEKLIGDPHQPLLGITRANTLPEMATFRQDYPHSLFKPGINVIDFACGTGIVTEKLAPYLAGDAPSAIVGLDISDVFLEKFNERGATVAKEHSNISMTSEAIDILDPAADVSKYENWSDVILCTIAYHHLHNYEEITAKLVTFLKPGGWLFIFDFYNEDVENVTSAHTPNSHAVSHMGGLKIESLNRTLASGGLVNVSSAREFRVNGWQKAQFINTHLPQLAIDRLAHNELETHPKDPTLYAVPVSMVLAMGQKP